MSEADPASPADEINRSHSPRESDALDPAHIQALEEEIINLAAEDSSKEKDDNINKIESSPIAVNKESLDIEDSANPFNVVAEESPKENHEALLIKHYQGILQELKEEISKLNRQIDQKTRQKKPEPSEEELFKLQALVRLSKAEAKELRNRAQKLAEDNCQLIEKIESFKNETEAKEISNEKIENLEKKKVELENEYLDLSKPDEINFENLEKVIVPDANMKIVNEFYVLKITICLEC
jgi:hypothetical protein